MTEESPTKKQVFCKEDLSDSDDESDTHHIFNDNCIQKVVDT